GMADGGNTSGTSMGETQNPPEHETHGMNMGSMPGIQMENVPGMKMENESKQAAEEYAKRARMTGMNAPGQPGPRTSAEFTVPDMGSMKAPLSENVEPHPDPQVDNVAKMPTERLSSTGEGFPPG